jgi:Icc-related predicted phosphoesterase
MKIALASDLHLEFQTITLPNTEGAKVLILSGDICVAHSLHDHPINKPIPADAMKPGRNQSAAYKYREFFDHVSQEYEYVVYVAGNHEFYHGRYPDAYEWLDEEMKRYNNIHFLDMSEVEIDGVTFVGGTLWTDMNKNDPTTMQLIESMMNDFRIIRNSQRNYARFSPLDAVIHHKATLQHIKKTVDSDTTKTYVVVGHHAPTPLSVHEKFKNEYYMNGGYQSDLSEFILDRHQIKLWTHGHMHDPVCYYMGDTLVAANPRGYAGHDPAAANFKLRFIDLDNMPAKTDDVNWNMNW